MEGEHEARHHMKPGLFILLWVGLMTAAPALAQQKIQQAAAPLYRDPIYDGAADPVVFYNPQDKNWWMLYTQRRANADAAGVAYCYGTAIGIATSDDQGRTWVYRGHLSLEFEHGKNTFWAPDVVLFKGTWHLFVAYIRGVRDHWGGNARIAHYTGKDLWDLHFSGFVPLTSPNVIDPTLFRAPDGMWRMWYKDQDHGSHIMTAKSADLDHWIADTTAVLPGSQEGPVVFHLDGWYWMLTDEWQGMRVYRSKDLDHWEKQGRILTGPSGRSQDGPSGAHGDVVVLADRAYIFYFTHPGRKKHTEAPAGANGVVPYDLRRSCIQVGPLKVKDGTLVCDRTDPFDFRLPGVKLSDGGQQKDDRQLP